MKTKLTPLQKKIARSKTILARALELQRKNPGLSWNRAEQIAGQELWEKENPSSAAASHFTRDRTGTWNPVKVSQESHSMIKALAEQRGVSQTRIVGEMLVGTEVSKEVQDAIDRDQARHEKKIRRGGMAKS